MAEGRTYPELNEIDAAKSADAPTLGEKVPSNTDKNLVEEVYKALKRHRDFDNSAINVSAKGGEVTLSGTVDALDIKYDIEIVVGDVEGVNAVNNFLSISREH